MNLTSNALRPYTMNSNNLSPAITHQHNRSLSSINSEAATFHSAHAHDPQMELSQLPGPQSQVLPPSTQTTPKETVSQPNPQIAPSSPRLSSTQMNRHDSGYSDGPSSRRTSTSSTSRRHSKRPSYSTTVRPNTKRSSISSPQTAQIRTSTSSRRPTLHSRHTAPYSQTTPAYEFFQFPSLAADPSPAKDPQIVAAPPPPPATCQYWTSDSTRRLEYAAIDAASRGVRGFFIKLVPDCILPPKVRRTKFCEGDDESDAGSVRRYRLALPEEKVVECGGRGRPGMLKRLTGLGRRSTD